MSVMAPDKSNAIVKLWKEGRSYTEIAASMIEAGYNVTRGVVAGRLHRLRQDCKVTEQVTPKPRPSNRKRQRTTASDAAASTKQMELATEVLSCATTDGVNYLDNEHGCRAILDKRGTDGLPMVCGLARGLDYANRMSSYCPTHFELFNNKPPSSNRRWY